MPSYSWKVPTRAAGHSVGCSGTEVPISAVACVLCRPGGIGRQSFHCRKPAPRFVSHAVLRLTDEANHSETNLHGLGGKVLIILRVTLVATRKS